MAILNSFLSWCGLVFLVGSVILYVRESKKSLPTKEEKDFLIKCGAIPPDCKNKKTLRQATLDYRRSQYVLNSLELTGEEILQLSIQAQERKAKKNTLNVIDDKK